jgi:hypothetical protein
VSITPGARFGHWTVVSIDGRRAICQCRCGNHRALFARDEQRRRRDR